MGAGGELGVEHRPRATLLLVASTVMEAHVLATVLFGREGEEPVGPGTRPAAGRGLEQGTAGTGSLGHAVTFALQKEVEIRRKYFPN